MIARKLEMCIAVESFNGCCRDDRSTEAKQSILLCPFLKWIRLHTSCFLQHISPCSRLLYMTFLKDDLYRRNCTSNCKHNKYPCLQLLRTTEIYITTFPPAARVCERPQQKKPCIRQP